jgi:hypothetical protein
MLRLLKPTMKFKGEEAIKEHRGGEEILEKYLVNLRNNINASKIEVSSLKYTYKEFVLVVFSYHWFGIHRLYAKEYRLYPSFFCA